MIVVAIFPAVLVIVGMLVYLLASKPETKEMGRLAFACGLLVLAYAFVGSVVRVG